MTQREIADSLGASQPAVCKLLRRHNISARPPVTRKGVYIGTNAVNWIGDKVGYKGAHNRVTAARGRPKRCERCGADNPQSAYDWHNLTGKYHDPNDYVRLCRSCHCKSDQREHNLGGHAKRQDAIHRRQ